MENLCPKRRRANRAEHDRAAVGAAGANEEDRCAAAKARTHVDVDIPSAVQHMLIAQYAPPAVLINEQGDIVFVQGRTGKYLEPSAGKASMNVFFMAREGLRLELSAAVRKACRTRGAVALNGLRVRTNGSFENVNLTVRPCGETGLRGLLLIVFQDTEEAGERRRGKALSLPVMRSAAIRQLDKELKVTKETLQSTVEEMETSQEELKSTNEELQSTNEELQSSNEELTTSKEEMQSLNEELVTVNTELESKVDALSRANNDMKNLLDSIDLATIFLDNHLNIKRFTQPITKLINLIPADIGRPIAHIVSNLKYDTLVADDQDVMRTLVCKERPVETKSGEWYQMRIAPYRTLDNVIDGTAITFNDISAAKELEKALQRGEANLRCERLCTDAVAAMSREPLLLLDAALRIVAASPAFCGEFGYAPAEIIGQPLFNLGGRQWNRPEVSALFERVRTQPQPASEARLEFSSKGAGAQKWVLRASGISTEDGNLERIILTFERIRV